MASGAGQTRPRRRVIPVCLSMLAMAMAWLTGLALQPYEDLSSDVLMRLRCRLDDATVRRARARSDIVLVAIDPESQDRLGRYGQGAWLSREPFFEQLAFFAAKYKPSVMGFDVIFQEEEGWVAADGWVETGPTPTEEEICTAIAKNQKEGRPLSLPVIRQINRIVAKQGNLYLGHCLAEVRDAFPVVAGYSIRGGWLNEQAASIAPWSDTDVFGPSPEGDENEGARVPFLKDMAIPDADVRLPPDGFRDSEYAWNANLPSRNLLNYVGLGFLDGPPDPDGVLRRVPMVAGIAYSNRVTGAQKRIFVPSLSLAIVMTRIGLESPLPAGAVQVDFGKEIRLRSPKGEIYRIPIDRYGRYRVNFNVLFSDFKQHSLARFVGIPDGDAGRRIAEMYRSHFDGSVIFVGVTLTGVDWGACPVDRKTPRVFVHMAAANNILNQDFLAPFPPVGRNAVLLALAVLCAFLAVFIRGIRVAAAFVGVGVAYALAAFLCAQSGLVLLPVVTPLLYLVQVSLLVLLWRYFSEERERKRIHGMFSTMVSSPVLRYLEEHPESFSLRGHGAEVTVFFSDITGFTKMSESMPPDQLVMTLNAYFTPVTDAIMDAEGYLDKYTGDGIMAVWGAPYANPAQAEKACGVALRQRDLMEQVNATLSRGTGSKLRVRTGINSGHAVAGNLGSGRRPQYTVVGDVVNLAARLEPYNKDFDTDTILGPATREMVKGRFVTRRLGRLLVHGKQEITEAYELVGEQGGVAAAKMKAIAEYEQALQAFEQRNWTECIACLESVLKEAHDGPSAFLLRRAIRFKSAPPDEGWRGEFVREHKQ